MKLTATEARCVMLGMFTVLDKVGMKPPLALQRVVMGLEILKIVESLPFESMVDLIAQEHQFTESDKGKKAMAELRKERDELFGLYGSQ